MAYHGVASQRNSTSGETLVPDVSDASAVRDCKKNVENSENEKPQANPSLALHRSRNDRTQDSQAKQIIHFPLSDPEHPNNWSKRKKRLVEAGGMLTVVHSTLGSSLPGNAVSYIAGSFGVTSELQHVLPISCFLIGYVLAPFVCSPLSEHFGRKPVMLTAFTLFTLFTMACAVAPTWPTFLLFRFLVGLAASAPIACCGGIFADINGEPRARGRTMALFMAMTTFGPVLAPPMSGFIAENTTWRWVFGAAAIFAGATLPMVIIFPETYAPALLRKRAAKMRKESGNENIIADCDLQPRSLKYVVSVVMTRPIRMLFQELIVSTTCLYLSLCYGIFYLYFAAYPIIFLGPTSVYNFSPGIAGLCFIPIALGSIISYGVFLAWDIILARAQARNVPWSKKEEFRRLPLALLGGPLFAGSLFWLGWTARPGIFWLAPVASGVAFGLAFVLIFMALLNYLSDAYMTYSASAQGIASTCRSLLGVLLPLASGRMFHDLGISWACSVLGFLCVGIGIVPWLFIVFGERIRAGSKFCQELHELHRKELEEKDRVDCEQAGTEV